MPLLAALRCQQIIAAEECQTVKLPRESHSIEPRGIASWTQADDGFDRSLRPRLSLRHGY